MGNEASEDLPREWSVSCLDAAGRKRSLVVYLLEDLRVVLKVPAGESAYLTSAQIGDVCLYLRTANELARRADPGER